LNGWWCVWKDLSGQNGKPPVAVPTVAATAEFGSEHVVPVPFVQPGPVVMPAALSQPPEYQAQSTPLADRRSPIVSYVWVGSAGANGAVGQVEGS